MQEKLPPSVFSSLLQGHWKISSELQTYTTFGLCSTELLQCRAPPVEGWRDPTQRWRHCARSKYVVLELDCTRCPQGPSRTYHKLLCANAAAAAAAGCQSSAPAVSTSYDPVVVSEGYNVNSLGLSISLCKGKCLLPSKSVGGCFIGGYVFIGVSLQYIQN